MSKTVIGIGLDGCDSALLENWIAQGRLKNLSKISRQGVYARLKNTINYNGRSVDFFASEPLWAMFSTGCHPNKTKYWDSIHFDPNNYQVREMKLYEGNEYPPFYALNKQYQVTTFDLPVQPIHPQVNGIQIRGWGGHFLAPPRESQPAELLPELLEKYGGDPIFYKDDGKWWNQKYTSWLQSAIRESSDKRASICEDLLKRQHWDLFLTAFGDLHAAGHDLYDQSQSDHPLYSIRSKGGLNPDPLLEAHEAVDEAIGRILDAAPKDAYILVFSVHGMGANHTDVLSMFTLPELLYRFNFPGQVGFASGQVDVPPPEYIKNPIRKGWCQEVWRTQFTTNPIRKVINNWAPKKFIRSNQGGLLSPYEMRQQEFEFSWSPAMIYSPLWPQMQAFATPAFASGNIRINLKGREKNGIVLPSEYDQLCDSLTEVLYRLKDGRTGSPIVKEVVRTRQSAADINDSELPTADLVVVWHETPTDIVDSPDFGRIGPVTLNRPGGHRPRGFLLAKGPGIESGLQLEDAQVVDLAPTFLSLMEAPVPDYLDGKSLIQVKTPSSSQY